MRPSSLRRLASAALPALLIGCTAVPMAPGSAAAQEGNAALPSPEAGTRADAQLMFEIMIAELAGRRGRLDVALEGYAAASARTGDTRVAERAARLAIFARRWDVADTALSRWRTLDPDAAEPLDLQAQVHLRRQRPDAAAASFIERIEAADDADAALADIGELLQGDPDAAVAATVAQALVDRYPDSAGALLVQARLALAAGELQRAAERLDRALERDADNVDAILVRSRLKAVEGDVDGAVQMLDEAIERRPDELALRTGLAQLLVEAGRRERVDGALDALAERADGDADALLSLGMLAMEADREPLARTAFDALLTLGEHRDQAHFQLARLSDMAGDIAAAIAGYDAVGSEALYVSAQLRAAELVAQAGAVEQAQARIAALREVVVDPSVQPRLVGAEGRLLQRAGRSDEALAVLSEGLEAFPDDGELRYARALAADGAGQPDVLVSDLTTLIEAEPDNAHALNALGYHFVQRNERLDEAAGYLEKASDLLPEDPAVMDSLGWLRFRQGQLDEAIRLLRDALALLPDPEIAAHLGEALWSAGRQDEARAVWDTALADAPQHPVLNETVTRLTGS